MTKLSRFLGLTALAVLTGCGTSPEPGYYTLAPVDGAAISGVTGPVKIARPNLPAFLDQPNFVSQSGDYALRVNETVNWSAPLDKMFAQVLAADLQQRLPGAVVQTDEVEANAPPRFIVESTLQQFNKIDHGQAVLRGTYTLADRAAHIQPGPLPVALSADTGFGGSSATAAALSSLIGAYADQIASSLRAQSVNDATPVERPQPARPIDAPVD